MAVTVRPLREDDYPQWRPLWDGYTHFYDCYLEESVTASTWERALSAHSPMFCRVVEKNAKVIGFAMCSARRNLVNRAHLLPGRSVC